MIGIDFKFFPCHGLKVGVGLGVDSGMTESLTKALDKEQLVPTTWIPAGPNSQLAGLTKRLQKLRHRKNTGQDWSRMCNPKRLWKKPTLSNYSVSHSLTSRTVLPRRCCYWLRVHPMVQCTEPHTFPQAAREASSQPVLPMAPCLQLKIQSLGSQIIY